VIKPAIWQQYSFPSFVADVSEVRAVLQKFVGDRINPWDSDVASKTLFLN